MSDGVGSWLQQAGTDVGNFGLNNWQTILPMAASAGLSMYSNQQQNEAMKKAAQQNQALWQSTAFPNQAAVDASAIQNRGALGQARLGSYQNLANQLAARGFGSGSGLGVKGASNIESGYLQGMGKMLTDLTKFQNTPSSGLPQGAYYQPGTTAGGAGANTLGSALGFMQAMQWLQGKKQPGIPSYGSNMNWYPGQQYFGGFQENYPYDFSGYNYE